MKSVVFFNNKGGVGKTTLAGNVASDFSTQMDLRVLLVDCDPQCNATQLILDTDTWTDLYVSGTPTTAPTIMDIVQPLTVGDSAIQSGVQPLAASGNRFGVDLIPGHPRMSIVEDLLSRAWTDSVGGDIGGMRRTNWISALLSEYESKYDVIVFDVGPSLGSLNRTVLLGAEYFATPMGADIFSIVGVRNIAEWLRTWNDLYTTGRNNCESQNPGALAGFGIDVAGDASAQFVGYTVQQYITKSKQGVRRPTAAFENILNNIPGEVEGSLRDYTPSRLDREALRLGDVPNMFSLIPLAQSVNAPISALLASDGLAGGQYQQQLNYVATIRAVSDALARNIGVS